MDETIDLRPYVDSILRRWWVILGAVIVSVLIAVFLYFSQSSYRAAALIAITDPVQRLQFDPRLVSILNLDDLVSIYPELAASDDVLTVVLEEARDLTDDSITSLPQLESMVDVETGNDPRLMRLIVRSDNPQLAADLANIWAKTFVMIVDKVYLGQSGETEFYENLLTEATAGLQQIEQALVDFQSGSRLSIVDNELLSLNDEHASYLSDQRRLNQLLEDIHALRRQVKAGTGDTVTWADQFTALMLQIKAFEPSPSTHPCCTRADTITGKPTGRLNYQQPRREPNLAR
jgi:capsular polysaccharide biosynthesis protein